MRTASSDPRQRPRRSLAMLVLAVALHVSTLAHAAEPQLPDLFPWKDMPKEYMYGGFVVANQVPGKTIYRFNFPMANIGAGPLELRETTTNDTQTIYQRIFDEDGQLYEERVVGIFPNSNPPYGHFFLEGIAHYRIREVLPGDGVGDVLTTHEKISYALVDSDDYNLALPNASSTKHYLSATAPMVGISVGWADLYGDGLPGQWADITDLADGAYWLECEIDPFNRILEANETNNVDRVKINVTVPDPTILAGDYNRDGIVNGLDYALWRNTLKQKVAQGTAADGDGSGRIGVPDFDVWKLKYGDTNPASAGGIAVPEPSTATLLYLLFALMFACGLAPIARRRRRTLAAAPAYAYNGPHG